MWKIGIDVRKDMTAVVLRKKARGEKDGRVVARMMGIANILDGMDRTSAARAAGMDRQTLCDWVHRYNQDGLAGLCNRPRGRPERLLTPEQEKNFAANVAKILPEHALGKLIEFWFQDEARVGQKGTLTHIWAKCGTRPRMTRDLRYTNAYIFGAVCPARDTGVALVLPEANTEAMNLHLAEIAKAVPTGASAGIGRHCAEWHQGRGQRESPDGDIRVGWT